MEAGNNDLQKEFETFLTVYDPTELSEALKELVLFYTERKAIHGFDLIVANNIGPIRELSRIIAKASNPQKPKT